MTTLDIQVAQNAKSVLRCLLNMKDPQKPVCSGCSHDWLCFEIRKPIQAMKSFKVRS